MSRKLELECGNEHKIIDMPNENRSGVMEIVNPNTND